MPFPVIILYLVFIAVVFPLHLIPEDRIETANDAIITCFCLGGFWFFWRVSNEYSREDPIRLTWLFIAAGVGLEGVGHAVYFVTELIRGDYLSFPHPGDCFIVSGEICIIYGLYSFNKQLNTSAFLASDTRKMTANILFILFGIAMWIWVIQPVLGNEEEPMWLRIAYQIYPIIGIILGFFCLHISLAMLDMGSALVARPWQILAGAYFLFVLTDGVYGYMETVDAYHPYSWINPCWGIAYGLIAYAAYRQYRLLKTFSIGHS